MATKLTTDASRPLTDREVAKMLCGTLGTAASFGTDAETLRRALAWTLDRWPDPRCPRNPCSCDGYHTFVELYDHRIALWIALCAAVGVAWRSTRHSDGTTMDGWFLLGLGKAQGFQMTYHLPATCWGDTGFAETLERAPEFDGHTPDDVLARLADLARDCAPTVQKETAPVAPGTEPQSRPEGTQDT